MNSTMAIDGTLFAAKNPNYGNLQGTDIDVWNKTGFLGQQPELGDAAFASNQDLFVPSALWLVSDEGPAANVTPDRWRRRPRRLDADRDPGHLERHAADHLRVPVAALRRRGLELRRTSRVRPARPTRSTAADVGARVRVLVTAVNDAGSSTPSASRADRRRRASSARQHRRARGASGTAVDGGTLTADPGTWTGDGPIDLHVPVAALRRRRHELRRHRRRDRRAYTPTGADVDHAIVVVVTATNPGGSTTEASAADQPVAAAPPVNTSPPTSPAPRRRRHADRRPRHLDRHAADRLRLPVAALRRRRHELRRHRRRHGLDLHARRRTTSATRSPSSSPPPTPAATSPHRSAATAGRRRLAAARHGAPALSGTVELGADADRRHRHLDRHRADHLRPTSGSAATPTAPTAWTSAARPTTPTRSTAADQGHTVVVVVTATNAAGVDTPTSAPSAVLPAPPVNTAPPAIAGEAEVGEALTADHGTWSGTGPLTYEYQWQRCDFFGNNCVDIAGATDDSYTLTDDDAGHTITVVVTATNSAGDSAGAPSSRRWPSTAPTDADPDADPDCRRPRRRPTPTPRRRPAAPAATAVIATAGDSAASADSGGATSATCRAASSPTRAASSSPATPSTAALKLRGIGTVRVRAYTTGPATKLTPILVTTQISHAQDQEGHVLHARRPQAQGRRASRATRRAITPSQLQRIGVHKLKATVQGQGQAKGRSAPSRSCSSSRPSPAARCSPPSAGARRRAPACACGSTRGPRSTGISFKVAGRAAAAPEGQAAARRLHARVRRRPEPPQALPAQARQEGQEDARGTGSRRDAQGRGVSSRPARAPRASSRSTASRSSTVPQAASQARARALGASVRPKASR